MLNVRLIWHPNLLGSARGLCLARRLVTLWHKDPIDALKINFAYSGGVPGWWWRRRRKFRPPGIVSSFPALGTPVACCWCTLPPATSCWTERHFSALGTSPRTSRVWRVHPQGGSIFAGNHSFWLSYWTRFTFSMRVWFWLNLLTYRDVVWKNQDTPPLFTTCDSCLQSDKIFNCSNPENFVT